jgi:hypothetical protein
MYLFYVNVFPLYIIRSRALGKMAIRNYRNRLIGHEDKAL